jgi:hypothetical protein
MVLYPLQGLFKFNGNADMIMGVDEWPRNGKEIIMGYFKILLYNSLDGTNEAWNH